LLYPTSTNRANAETSTCPRLDQIGMSGSLASSTGSRLADRGISLVRALRSAKAKPASTMDWAAWCCRSISSAELLVGVLLPLLLVSVCSLVADCCSFALVSSPS
jgi:hypothetical protein